MGASRSRHPWIFHEVVQYFGLRLWSASVLHRPKYRYQGMRHRHRPWPGLESWCAWSLHSLRMRGKHCVSSAMPGQVPAVHLQNSTVCGGHLTVNGSRTLYYGERVAPSKRNPADHLSKSGLSHAWPTDEILHQGGASSYVFQRRRANVSTSWPSNIRHWMSTWTDTKPGLVSQETRRFL